MNPLTLAELKVEIVNICERWMKDGARDYPRQCWIAICYWKCSFTALPQTTYGNTWEPDIADTPVTQIGFQVLTNLADPWLMPHLAGWEVLSLPAQVSPCHPHQPSWDAPSPVLITGWDDNCVCREPDQMISQALFVSKPVKLCVLHTIRIESHCHFGTQKIHKCKNKYVLALSPLENYFLIVCSCLNSMRKIHGEWSFVLEGFMFQNIEVTNHLEVLVDSVVCEKLDKKSIKIQDNSRCAQFLSSQP